MCKKLIYLISFALVLSLILTSAANADLLGWWRLIEGSGDTAEDSSGSGNHGTINNLNGGLGAGGAVWVDDPERRTVLSFNGDNSSGAYVSTDLTIPAMNMENGFTWAFWAKQQGDGTGINESILGNRYAADGSDPLEFIKFTPTKFEYYNNDPDYTVTIDYDDIPSDVWIHHAGVKDGTTLRYYRNGVEAGTSTITFTIRANPFYIGGFVERWSGYLSDVRLYNRALTPVEIMGTMAGEPYPYAFGPSPADGALYADTWAYLAWKAGDFAVSHNVYMGENFADVDAGTGGTFIGNVPESDFMEPYLIVGIFGYPFPEGLVPGSTYYWRVDEVNDANVDSPWKGNVWSFSIPARTAREPVPGDGAWFVETDATLTWTPGFGANFHAVYFGDDFDTVNNASGTPGVPFTTYTPAALEPDKTYYWRVDETDALFAVHKGDVWSFTTLPDIPLTSDPNLVGWWKLEEGPGNTAIDWSGHGNHATLQGDPEWVEGYDGGALQCDGSGDWATTGLRPADFGLDGANPKTVTAWVYTTGFNNGGIYDMGSQ
ncbi:MAG: LamG domain-containing protein, partial [Planctomycetota bacterium]